MVELCEALLSQTTSVPANAASVFSVVKNNPRDRRRHPISAHGVYLGAFDLAVKRLRGGAGRAALPPAPPRCNITRW